MSYLPHKAITCYELYLMVQSLFTILFIITGAALKAVFSELKINLACEEFNMPEFPSTRLF